MPHLKDPNFEKSVVLMCDHGDEGSMGLVVNRPIGLSLGQLFELQGIKGTGSFGSPVHYGGPVQPELGFVLFNEGEYADSINIGAGIKMSSSLDIVTDISNNAGPEKFLFTLGYAGWAPGQMEAEIARNDWLAAPANPKLIFESPPEKRWDEAIRILGIDPGFLSVKAGRA